MAVTFLQGEVSQSLIAWLQDAHFERSVLGRSEPQAFYSILHWMTDEPRSALDSLESWQKIVMHKKMVEPIANEAMKFMVFAIAQSHFNPLGKKAIAFIKEATDPQKIALRWEQSSTVYTCAEIIHQSLPT